MNDNQILLQISQQIGSLVANMNTVLSQLANHQVRIQQLEQNKTAQQFSLKDDVVKYLTIALIGSISVIVTLTGASSVLKSMFGAN